MSAIRYDTTRFGGTHAYIVPEQVFIKAGGEGKGTVWLRDHHGAMTPAQPEAVEAAEAQITGFAAAVAACEAIEE